MPDNLQIHNVTLAHGNKTELFLAQWAKIDAATAGANKIIPLSIGRKVRVLGLKFSCADAVTIKWQSSSTDLGPAESFAAKGGMSDYWGPYGCLFETSTGEDLNMFLGGSVQVSGWICYLLV
jgi:hypothetical protein